jgi:hypothetical protein
MNIRHHTQRVLILAASVCLSACAANVVRTDAQSQTASAPKIAISPVAAKKINLVIGGSEAMTTSSDWQAFVDEWLTSMSAETSAAGITFTLLKRAEQALSEPSVLVNVTVNDFRYMSQVKRYMIGVLGGNAYMDLNVEFVEMPSKNVVGTRKYNTSTSGGQGIFSAATPKQVQAVAADIVNAVKGSGTSR